MSELMPAHFADTVAGIDLKDASVREMLWNLIRALAEDEDAVEVIYVTTPEGVTFHVHCSPKDVGRLIGNRGRTARAIRAVLKAIASKNSRRYTLVIAQ